MRYELQKNACIDDMIPKRLLSKGKLLTKQTLAYTLYYSGIFSLIKKLLLKGKVIVLMYHRVMPREVRDASFSHDSIIIETRLFERQLDFLKRQFDVLSVDTLVEHISNNKPITKPSCLITLDDGWSDNHQYALDAIKRVGVPAVIFLPIDYIGSEKLFWQEKLSRAIAHLASSHEGQALELLKKFEIDLDPDQSPEQKKQVIHDFIQRLKRKQYDDLEKVVSEIGNLVTMEGLSGHPDSYLNWSQVEEMIKFGVNFGSHACSHRILTRLTDSELEAELKTSADRIAALDQSIPLTIAYPNGDNDKRVQEAARKNGYLVGFGTQRGIVNLGDNCFDLKRINVNETATASIPMFMLTLLKSLL
jgi:peptidoglycan/xylan/chitin deacetylase (PgdA/CDA1 family)